MLNQLRIRHFCHGLIGLVLAGVLHHCLRLSRLTLVEALLNIWLISIGDRSIREGLRPLVDCIDHRDLSIFQIGLRFIERRSTNASRLRLPPQ